MTPRDRAFCAALFYTTVSRLITLDYAIAAHSTRPLQKLHPAVLAALRCGFCQLLYMDGVTDSAAVNETVEVVRQLGRQDAAGFVNGVMRGFIRAGRGWPVPKDKLTALSVSYGVPMPLIQLWRKGYGHEKTLDILNGLEGAPPLYARINTLKTTAPLLCGQLEREGVQAEPVPDEPGALLLQGTPGGVAALPSFAQGLFHIQDLSSQRCAAAAFGGGFIPKRILDVCAAPGGKSFTMAQLAGASTTVVSRDLYPARVELIRTGAQRLGLEGIDPQCGDATVFEQKLGLFDLVLCDVVCSGFGILRRKPEIRYKQLKALDGLPDMQYNILNTSSRYCAPGGRLVYSTCTLNPAENEQVVRRFLEQSEGFAILGEPVTVFPTKGGADGFFYTVLEKLL